MSFVFTVGKAIQATAVLVKREKDQRFNLFHLIKLLYIADRESLREVGYPITGDEPFAMDHGPVLTRVYDLIKKRDPHPADQERWSEFFSTTGRMVKLLCDPGDSELCDHEISLLEKVFDEHAHKVFDKLRDETHEFEEWKRSYRVGTSSPISLADTLKAVGRESDIAAIRRRRLEDRHFAAIFGE